MRRGRPGARRSRARGVVVAGEPWVRAGPALGKRRGRSPLPEEQVTKEINRVGDLRDDPTVAVRIAGLVARQVPAGPEAGLQVEDRVPDPQQVGDCPGQFDEPSLCREFQDPKRAGHTDAPFSHGSSCVLVIRKEECRVKLDGETIAWMMQDECVMFAAQRY